METTTQPILCCLGESVAGAPTQFMLERAIGALGLDWRVMTVEVAVSDFADALAGIKAMKFQGVRFFGSFEHLASLSVLPSDETSEFVGGITSAARIDQGLTGWHNRGFGICNELSRGGHWKNMVCWLHGDSVAIRSFIAAATFRDTPKKIVWSAVPEALPASLRPDGTDGHWLSLVEDSSEAIDLLSSLADTDLAANPLWHLAVLGEPPDLVRLWDSPVVAALDSDRVVVCNSVCSSALRDLGVSFKHFSEVDQIIASEAYDFWRWTGQRPDLGQLREAYEEYCDF